MYEILEEWIPVKEFEKDFPGLRTDHFVKINHLIIIYRVVRNDNINIAPQIVGKNIFFSLEDAWNAIDNI